MAEFNFHNSTVEQVTDSGTNIKLVSTSGNNAVTQQGDITQTAGGTATTKERVYIDDIDSFAKVREVSAAREPAGAPR